jgi:tetraacyldisaccharide 4'-kinase
MLAAALEGVAVIVGADRAAGVRAASAESASVAILDDGFQHRRLGRDLDLVLLDGDEPFGNSHLLPAGPLREPPSALRRAHLAVLTRTPAVDDRRVVAERLRELNPELLIVRAGHRSAGFVDASGRQVAAPRRALVFCGIARPERLREDLDGAGVALEGFRAFRDHHRYAPREIADLERAALERNCVLVTTEKDLARLGPSRSRQLRAPLLALRIETVVHDTATLDAALTTAIATARRR